MTKSFVLKCAPEPWAVAEHKYKRGHYLILIGEFKVMRGIIFFRKLKYSCVLFTAAEKRRKNDCIKII